MNLGIVQSLPNAPAHVVRTDSFSKFQAICGLIERDDYLAAHAACHATMNGIDRTTAVHADPSQLSSVVEAVERLLGAAEDLDAIVLPGICDTQIQDDVCSICAKASAGRDMVVLLDPEERASIEEIVARQKCLPRFATLTWPRIQTVTPGRRSADKLPASCLAAPLVLGCAPYLRGVHDMPDISLDAAQTLAHSGVAVLVGKVVGRRRVVALYGSSGSLRTETAPKVDAPDVQVFADEESAFEAQLQATLQDACATCLAAHPTNNRDLWGALARCATAVLMRAKSRGQIVDYHVRCDEETASWGTPDAPVVEIILKYPKRVRSIRFDFC